MAINVNSGRINVGPNDRAFLLKNLLCDYFNLGRQDGDDYWLQGEIVGDNRDFIFNGRLFLPDGGSYGTIIDNFPKGPAPKGWIKRPNLTSQGFSLTDDRGRTLFGYEMASELVCHVTVDIFAKDGTLAAQTSEDGFTVHKAPAQIGSRGIILA